MSLRFPHLVGLTFLCSFSLAAWPNPRFGQWPALFTVLLLAWQFSPLLGGRPPLGRLLDSGLLLSLLTALLALFAVQTLRGIWLGVLSATILLLSVAARFVWSTRMRRTLPATPGELLVHLLTEPPDRAE